MINRNRLVSLLVLVAGALLGYLAAVGTGNYLAIEYHLKDFSGLNATYPEPDSGFRGLALRMVDLGGVGVLPDTLDWGNNYEHNQHVFEDVIEAGPSFVNDIAFRREMLKLSEYAGRMAGFGYNAITLPWFLECINFDMLGDGYRVYGPESLYRSRHDTLTEKFGELMKVAAGSGLRTYLWTDMVALTPPLRSYLNSRFGSPDTEDPAFWEVYRKAAEEAFKKFPLVDGIVIRIGEAGTIYNKPGWDYTSELLVRTPEAVRMMLNAFLGAAEKYDRTIIFRTWSVGVGEIGDMHTNPDTYREVLEGMDSRHLVVSTKYCKGDFYSWLEFNPTLFQGNQRRITEIQAKREFEGFGALPNYVAPLHQKALQAIITGNPKFEGAWVWTQYGGPLRAGPMIIYPFYGMNVINDVNVYAISRLLDYPWADLDSITSGWIRSYFGSDSLLIANLTRFLNVSYEVLTHGLYISEFAKYDVKALGLEPPPMLWIFEWDILGASSSVFSNIYLITRDRFDSVIREGRNAVRGTAALKELLEEVRNRVGHHREEFDMLLASVDYETDLFRMLGYYREYFMNYYRWIDTGDRTAAAEYKLAMGQFSATADHLQSVYSGNLNTLGMDLEEALTGVRIAERTPLSVRWARVLLVVELFLLIMGIPGFIRNRAHRKFAGTLQFDALFRPYSISILDAWHSTRRLLILQMIVWMLTLVIFSSFTSWLFPLVTGLAGLSYVLVLALLNRTPGNLEKILTGLMAPRILLMSVLMLAVAIRGPMYFWYQFWTSGSFRMLFMIVWFLLLFRKFQVHLVVAGKWNEKGRSEVMLSLLSALGIQILLVGLALQFFGLERSMTALNNDLLVLPGGLSKIMGITTHLGIPLSIPAWITGAGILLTVPSLSVIFVSHRRRKRR